MPRTAKQPRLYLRRARRDRGAVWVIKHKGVEISTGASKGEDAKAQAALADYIINGRTRSSFGKGHPDEVVIADAIDAYGEQHGPTTRRPEVIDLAIDKLAQFWGERKVSEITPSTCTEYVTWRSAQADGRAKVDPNNKKPKLVKPSTARRELVVLAAALQWCWNEKKLDRQVPVKLPPQAEPRERHLTRREAARLLWGALGWDRHGRRHHARINRHLARFIMLGLYTGTRHDAILKLQWLPNLVGGWIDLDAGILYRRPAGVVESGKRRPTIPLPPHLIPHLRRWRRLTAQYAIEWQGLPIRSQERRAWRRARELAGLDSGVTPHTLRHTCATWLLQRSVSLYDVAGVLGCGEDVVRRTYGHHAQDHLRAAVGAFSRNRGRAPEMGPNRS